jgi:predicted lipoprotein with Yx(FWY)xxD motif
MTLKALLPAVLFALATGCASPPPARVQQGVLVAPNGMTLYTHDRDPLGLSVCTDRCAAYWPPLTAPESANAEGQWSIIQRPDSTRQWTYRGKPLYYWSGDRNPGDRTGHGFGGRWQVARP